MNKKLKLTKLTVANLDRVKGGSIPCACHWTVGDGVQIMENKTKVTCMNPCPVPFTEDPC
ncbi:MAG: hypothetical protein GTO45_24855 [Candidatus Aminicenantes bacterium]|nr:hypothetical protein [Candidatus Aminicenantes bacterium]NIN21363.1 hypothetical protein [Candidatus Aminicenantes bacterium]NIN45184.1 hypothetical protein [Candidatus Aminicenantes bacterium]NIN88001.1 hypothetical protein [Candidatus Aminicenantes bacterium]NIQ70263.1 hypothetical protein [Candidatus Aminicenantes bacterium]